VTRPGEVAHRGRRSSRFTVQGWQNLVLSVMVVVVLAGTIAGALLLFRADHLLRDLTQSVGPARISAYQLQAALRDQETAMRGYAIAADRQFLQPYYEGQASEKDAAQSIRENLAGRTVLIDDLDAIEHAADAWRRSYAEPMIASVTPGAPEVLDSATTDRGKAQFDTLRALFDQQNEDLTKARDAGYAQLEHVRGWRDTVLVATIAVFFAAALLLAFLVRSVVTRPLDALAAACRSITEGNFDETIVPQGPKDIRTIAADVEDMRQRIVSELEATRSAQAQLADQALELQRSNAELEQFAYVASHDLQEPLRKVASFCQLLEKRYGDKLDERGTEYIGFAVDGAKRMQVLINDLLTFSRVGRLNTTLAEVDLGATLDEATENLAIAVEVSDAEIVRPTEPFPRIAGDPTLLTMLWQNLIGNAIKFRRDDIAPRVVIEFGRLSDEPDAAWSFSVSDNGIGIADEFVDKVFVIFQRLHGRDAYTGTGIGLALCKKIVEHHGGSIWIDTSYTDGTRFRFTVPFAHVADDEQVAAIPEGKPL
jgi:signal transduction histidine kinase